MNALKPVTPASASSGRVARLFGVRPPQSAKSAYDDLLAAATFASKEDRSRVGGCALSGISMQVVTPPAISARLPVSHPSHAVRPGSLKWTWGSMPPGSTSAPVASISRAAPPSSSGPISAISPSAMPMSVCGIPRSCPLRTMRSNRGIATCTPQGKWPGRCRPGHSTGAWCHRSRWISFDANLRHGSPVVNFPAMSNLHDVHSHVLIPMLADDTIVANTITPESCQVPRQSLATNPRIWQLGDFIEIRNDASLPGPVDPAKRFLRRWIELNRPVQGLS